MNHNGVKLRTDNLNLSFGSKHALKDISVSIGAHQVTALIGPSGCGKSTLLRCFNRMHDLVTDVSISGGVFLDDQDIYSKHAPSTEIRRKVGMVFQKPNPFPKSIYENVTYGLAINGFPRSSWRSITEEALRESFLWDEVKDDLDKPATRLSGGQQQRLCIARTVALRPEVILMDEPCSALDPISTSKIEELILKLKKDYTIVIVTHNMAQAQRVADVTTFMYLGEVIESGKTQDIFHTPLQELTRRYVEGHFG